MALGTIDRRAPPLFRHGLPLRVRWIAWSVLALVLLVADARWQAAAPLRTGLSAALSPMQTLAASPARWIMDLGQYFADLRQAQSRADKADQALISMDLRAAELTQLRKENIRLRQLLQLQEKTYAQGVAAEVVFATADAYSRKVLINKGSQQGIQAGSPVLGAQGVLGQVTQVYLQSAEVSLLIDQNFTLPVRNQRTQASSVAFGAPMVGAGVLELKYQSNNADIKVGDVLTTSGMDGVYPSDLAVATVTQVERHTNTTFARIYAQPLAQMGATYVLVLPPVGLAGIEPQALAHIQPQAAPVVRDARSKAKTPTKTPTKTQAKSTAAGAQP